MSRKGNCPDNVAIEQVFGHMKDEFFKGQLWDNFESFKRDLAAYIEHWNTKRPQVRLNGYALSEYRQRRVKESFFQFERVEAGQSLSAAIGGDSEGGFKLFDYPSRASDKMRYRHNRDLNVPIMSSGQR